MPDDAAQHGREPSADDFGVAQGVLSRLMPSLGRDTPEYRDKRQALARFRAEVGKDRFDLQYGLRPPRSAVERAEIDFFQGRVTQAQFREVLKADAERPIDAAMLDVFCDAYAERLLAYSRMLQTVVAIATDQREPDASRRREAEVDRPVEAMKAKLPLWKEQVATVFTFLAELQAERKGEPVRCGDRSAESAHMLASVVMDQVAEGWRSCREIAGRSRTDPSYLYAASASYLFHKAHLPGLPKPNDLMSLMVLDRARARKAVQRLPRPERTGPSIPASTGIQAQAVNMKAPRVRVTGTLPPASALPETGGSSNEKGGPAVQTTATAGDTTVHTHIHLDLGAAVDAVLKRLAEQQAAAPAHSPDEKQPASGTAPGAPEGKEGQSFEEKEPEDPLEGLPDRVRRAYAQHLFATKQYEGEGGGPPTDRGLYAWLKRRSEERLPAFETWVRYIRQARQALGEQKNSPRVGRQHGTSIVLCHDIEPPHQEATD